MGLFRPNETARAVAELFRLCPDEWTLHTYVVAHKSRVEVWIANRAYGLEVLTPGCGAAPGFGASVFGGGPSQRHVWKAFLAWKAANVPPQPHPVEQAVRDALAACREHTRVA